MVDPNEFPKIVSFTHAWHTKPYNFISPERPELSVSAKNVVVTGGGTGIGNAIATAFAQANANRADQTEVFYQVADITNRAQVDQALDSAVSKAGKLDILVSCAGVLPENGPIAAFEGPKLMRAFEVNVLGVVNVIQAFALRASSEPTLLNISTGTTHTVPVKGQGAYNASKLAALKLVDQFAAEN
ncbi:Hypothetical protein NCS54_00475000 [Fusarium falciforme]|uniref:Hypothetical protein n=1 Tax=Fusarium falciforme TaxID=195108 RepID=UPI00230098BA|nr:Hypothetical protein NCS54_00475000 [Fusarium falciforme]WAO87441.1 Hypothetical protein NCS54_00475000 [Fusarium falciforme]